MRSRIRVTGAALAGIAAATFGLGIGELLAALVVPPSAPLAVVGGAFIDITPAWLKELAVAWFGTADKIALFVGMGLVLAALAGLAGVWELRRPPAGELTALGVGILGGLLASTRSDASSWSWLPATTAALATALALRWLVPLVVAGGAAKPVPAASSNGAEPGRRQFLIWAAAAGAVGVIGLVTAPAIRGAKLAAEAIRSVVLPKPQLAAPAVPAAAELGIEGLTPVLTPTAAFFRIDAALNVPQLSPNDWELRIHGMVENEVVLTWDELLALPLEESITTLLCVSNSVGGDLIGNARWLGYPIRHLLARAEPSPAADMVLSRSFDGFTASTPLEALTDERNAILAVGMNGEPLTAEHGFPVRVVVPGLYGYVSATKWVVELEVTRFDRAQGYWTPRGWSAHGPVKLESRIDVPRPDRTLPAGDTVIAGVAWQQQVGIKAVEVQVDEGPWQQAQLAAAISADTWVQWSLPWTATPGPHSIRVRAINSAGQVQTAEVAPPAPDGATGQHHITVSVS